MLFVLLTVYKITQLMSCKIIHSEQTSLLLSLMVKKPGVWFNKVTGICILIGTSCSFKMLISYNMFSFGLNSMCWQYVRQHISYACLSHHPTVIAFSMITKWCICMCRDHILRCITLLLFLLLLGHMPQSSI